MISKIINLNVRTLFKILLKFSPTREPVSFVGEKGIEDLVKHIIKTGEKNVFLVTTPGMIRRNTLSEYIDLFEKNNVGVTIYTDTKPNPTTNDVNEGLKKLKESNSKTVLAVGGGSVLDSAKAIAVCGAMDVNVEKVIGLFKVKDIFDLYAVPTTSGSASEVTNSSVISDEITHEKKFIFSNKIIPKAIAIDPKATLDLPSKITAETGMDALTHSIEAYISAINDEKSANYSITSVKNIFENLPLVYSDGKNANARLKMANASTNAGLAFNRTGLGHVHAISHQLTAFYGIPHGLANAVVLPHVLEFLSEKGNTKIATLAQKSLNIKGRNDYEIAQKFIKEIKSLLQKLDIENKFEGIKESDFNEISKLARKQSTFSFPVTHLMSDEECKNILKKIQK